MTRHLVWSRPGLRPAASEPATRGCGPAPKSQELRRFPLQKLLKHNLARIPMLGRAVWQRHSGCHIWQGERRRVPIHRRRPARPTGRPFSRRAPSLRLTQASVGYFDLQEHGSNLEASEALQQPLTHDDGLCWLYQYGSFLCPVRITSPEWRQEVMYDERSDK